MKAQLIKPIKDQHRYVVGIDFGHGESSAAICSLEWETSAGHRENKEEDIDMDINARVKHGNATPNTRGLPVVKTNE